ncbi:NAD(P)-binding Rossmann-fold superfamily protein [Euphorbia peplus]|nr:NAD(P)-binding Rossmann-fold superfamily protein [Euphorbia peplus]
MWMFGWKGPSGFSATSTAEQVTQGIDGTALTAIVTGSSSGIGKETARVLALRDLGSIPSVRKFASEYISSGLPLNLLINNAGISLPPVMLSEDNMEIMFATNHLGHFLLTDLLLETMKNTARESNREGRIVNVSSVGHSFTYREGIRFDNINDEKGYSSIRSYGQSKLANILHANELARRLKEDGVNLTANSVHPGAVATNLVRNHYILNGMVSLFGKYLLKDIQQGAATTCYVALHPTVKGVTGEYFADNPTASSSSLTMSTNKFGMLVFHVNPVRNIQTSLLLSWNHSAPSGIRVRDSHSVRPLNVIA